MWRFAVVAQSGSEFHLGGRVRSKKAIPRYLTTARGPQLNSRYTLTAPLPLSSYSISKHWFGGAKGGGQRALGRSHICGNGGVRLR
ncbi:hypothetical protein H6P81_010673 [Aristolochia fimbriata]|uniref:Ribosomal protein L2 n=1 Tax=Aristolochia fimbriata TaxID=158543 RepID=A0AAV7ETV5_ARIFI|nr:hypothetical protein H6P81_010673 [Aristolochia fimbriata]